MLVSDIMTLEPNCCTPECTAQEAAGGMRRWSNGVLPVVDDLQNRKLVGIVTDRDLCLGVVAAGRVPAHVAVRECMTRETICCAPGEPVARALAAMRDHHVRRLPVVDSSQRVLGIISLTDIVRYAALSEPEVVSAVAHIAEPRGPQGGRSLAVGAAVDH